MNDRRVLLPLLLLLVGVALTGCGLLGGGNGRKAETIATSSEPGRAGTSEGDAVRPLRKGQGIAPGEAGTPGGPGPLPFPVPVSLVVALAAGVAVAAAGGIYMWSRNRRAGQTGPAAGVWQGVPGSPAPAGPSGPAPGQAAASPASPPGAPPVTSGTAHAAPGAQPRWQVSSGPPAAPPPGAPAHAGGGQATPAPDPLADALIEVASSGISQALTQQVERLFSGGHPGRAALVDACIGYRDQISERHPRLADRLMEGLNLAGVQEIIADGQRFDPRLHEAFGTEPTERPELHDLVAETVKRGYADGGRVIRVPQVAVYRHETPGGGTVR
ncbi:nucleotide exchange factor GrpE [Streptosporangium sp. NPDC051023]|uniref:nucleotide exchange factor GrpE n=1 Tax=Streptosporangium sp. NPDC051023 TaxID=3155410 RepID=UPI00344D29D4